MKRSVASGIAIPRKFQQGYGLLTRRREEARDLFYHGYDNYMRHAFPEDELRPLTCGPLTRDRANPAHIEVNDVLGNYSLTLIDSLSTLAILASTPAPKDRKNKSLRTFQDGIKLIVEYYGDGTLGVSGEGKRARGFDLDSKVQVFETVIRGVGGLLSAHLFAIGELPIRGYRPVIQTKRGRSGILWDNGLLYDGQLLRLAHDLGTRLLPAFHTPTGLPYPRVNLRHGIPFYANSPLNTDPEFGQCQKTPNASPEITETCSAGAGSLVLEFSVLSRMTGDARFEDAAKIAFWSVWQRRSSAGLIGSGIDAETGQWVTPYTGIGAGIDSFFEYAFKSFVLLSGVDYEPEAPLQSPNAYLAAWQDAHDGVKRHIYRGAVYQHPHYIQADLYTGAMRAFWIDSLSAYYPGLLVYSGELEEAIETHLLYTALWTRYSALPERWSTATGNIEAGLRWWGGRPEFIESTWYLYRATKDPWYLHVGEMALRDIKRRCWTKCGWAGLQDVRTGELSDRMESFFLGETAKYLFLLFDPTHPLNHGDSPMVFTTEGHPLIMPKYLRRRGSARSDALADRSPNPRFEAMCPLPPPSVPFSISATAARHDIFHAANLARLHLMPNLETLDSPLIEFSADHPSVSVSDLRSPSNYTYYPWTLPPELIPANGSSSKMAMRTTFDLSFPNLPNTASNMGGLQRINSGVLVNSMSGLRFGMVREPQSIAPNENARAKLEDLFRIYAVSNVPLGRDEKVFLTRDLVSGFNPIDPFFTRSRDMSALDLVMDVPSRSPTGSGKSEGNNSIPNIDRLDGSVFEDLDDMMLELPTDVDADDPSLLSSVLFNLQSMLQSVPSSVATSDARGPSFKRVQVTATLPTGPGAAPLPDLPEPSANPNEEDPLPYSSIYIGDESCSGKLPASVPKTHQVIVLKRGGCSFSEKLESIPSFAPSKGALQLVIIVSYPDHDAVELEGGGTEPVLVQPLLDATQRTPGGLTRPHPIPMVMVSGGDETMKLLASAKGVGFRRRWHFLSQGLRIGNLIVL